MEEILLHTDNTDAATAEIKSTGGRVTMKLGDDLLVAKVPDFIAKKNNFASASAYISASASPETLMFAQAYWTAREKKTRPQPPIKCWNEMTPPIVLPRESPYPENSPYAKTMAGKIASTVIVVSGPDKLAISATENSKIVSEIIVGLKFWTDAAPPSANLQFCIDSTFVPINAADSINCRDNCHDVFTNPALKALGISATGQAGVDELAQDIKDKSGADGAFIGFFSKYKQFTFAYALGWGGPVYMQYSNGFWGPDNIDRVFAHETGHVFDARDEYKSSCDCHSQYGKGTCTDVNGNCKSCTNSQTKCIMNVNDFNLCSYTKKHVGWCD